MDGPMGLGGNLADVVSTMKGAVTNLAALNSTLIAAFPRISGSFTLSAATTTLVTQSAISASSLVFWSPTNGTAALILRTNGLFHSANTPGSSFSLATQAGSATSGGTFEYFVINPS
jgi:hypothetical protein